MKKISIFLMMLCFAFFGVAKAQETLTVYDEGTTTNNYVPIYGLYCDEGVKCEFVIPAEQLEEMANGTISAMKFYLASVGYNTINPSFTIFVKEVDFTTMTAYTGTSGATTVFNSTFTFTSGASNVEIEVPFSEDYTYGGGNLLIGVYQNGTSGYSSLGWTGVSQDYNSAWRGYGSSTGSAQKFLPKTTFTYEPAQQGGCAKPTGLAVSYTGGTTATVTWNGTASQYDIDVNGTVNNNVTSPYTLSNLELATTYEVKVRANCGDEYSDYTSTKSFTTDACLAEDMCSITIELNDAYGDGGGNIQVVDATTNEVLATYSNSGASTEYTFTACAGTVLNFVFAATDNWPYENGYVITDPNGVIIAEHEGCRSSGDCVAPADGVIETYTMCERICSKPSNLQATNIGTTSAVLNWTGDNDSYVLQYRTGAHNNMDLWEQVGSDKSATATLTQYTYDLSDYSGTGNIAIRHYNVSDMFRLAIDDVIVTDARGQELVNEDFESGSIPSSWTNYDLDGDGNVWIAVSFDSQVGNGDYVAVSDSWNQSVGALTPDNWLIIPNVTLGGTLTFYARGVDANYPQENFGVFVTTASLETVFDDVPAGEWSAEITTTDNSYGLTGLEANMPYEWRVKGICGTDETAWATSSFTTITEGFKTFITTGDWNVADNWFPAGVPTIEDEVSIEAAATVPAGVVATAKRAVLNGGSILVKDGGQLKQGAATLNITMEKEITGYGEGDGNYYFIASPFGGRTQLAYNASWSHVLNVTSGDYDLYAFDATHELEWINYKSQDSNNPHELFYEMSLQSGTGYLYANKVEKTLTFTGTAWSSLNTVTTVDYTYNTESTDDWNGWKLVGNPYTCNAYINYVDANGSVLDADFYTLNNDNTYTLMSSNQPVPPCTGVMMNVSATGKIQYSTEAPANGKSSMLNMTVSEGNRRIDQARVRFGQGHNLKHMSFRTNSKLYMTQDNNDYAVVYTENEGEMPVSFKAEENGTYTLSFNAEEVSFGYLHLIDNMTGNDVDLLATPSYTFEAKTTDYESRFKLVFATGNNDDNFAFFSNGSFVINNEGNATLQVIDITGRIVKSESINGCANVNMNAAPGVYMLRLVNGENVKVQKVVVK